LLLDVEMLHYENRCGDITESNQLKGITKSIHTEIPENTGVIEQLQAEKIKFESQIPKGRTLRLQPEELEIAYHFDGIQAESQLNGMGMAPDTLIIPASTTVIVKGELGERSFTEEELIVIRRAN